MGPGGFCPTNPNLADILGRTGFDLDFIIFFGLPAWAWLGPSLGPGLGPAWAQLGLGLGPAWARAWAEDANSNQDRTESSKMQKHSTPPQVDKQLGGVHIAQISTSSP